MTKPWEMLSSGSVWWWVSLERPGASRAGGLMVELAKPLKSGDVPTHPARDTAVALQCAKGRQLPASPHPFYTCAKSGSSGFVSFFFAPC